MKTKKEVYEFLETLQWERMAKKELETKLQEFLDTNNTLEDGTDEVFKDVDYSFLFTNANEPCAVRGLIDIEIYYLKMRKRNHILITGTELLGYIDSY